MGTVTANSDTLREIGDATAIAVYMLLKTYTEEHGEEPHPSRAELAQSLGHSTCKAVDRALVLLEEQGLVLRYFRWGTPGKGAPASRTPGKGLGRESNGYVLRDTPGA